MKNIAILTIHSENFGNRLQNYALQYVLESLGAHVETLRRNKFTIKTTCKHMLRQILKNDKRTQFIRFDKQYINWSKYIVSREYVSDKLEEHYQYFVIGSDQIWNITFDFIGAVDFLPFVIKNKKISYAASFGITHIQEDMKTDVGALLKNIKAISVREDSGANIVHSLIGVNATVVLDPTMLVECSFWKKNEKKPTRMPEERYLLKYVLGSDVYNHEIECISKNKKLKVMNVINNELMIGPLEFIYLIHHADLVCTDSFHATVFSILFERPFITFERMSDDEDMSTRIDSLLKKLKLQSHRYKSSDFSMEKIYFADYNYVRKIIEQERSKSMDFLYNSLKFTEDEHEH